MPDAATLIGTADIPLRAGGLRLPDAFASPFLDGGVLTLWLDGCLALWPLSAWRLIANRVAGLPVTVEDGRAFSRLLFASATPFAGRRVVLPAGLRTAAGIGDRAVLIGVGGHAELWSTERWSEQEARNRLEDLSLPLAV
ncbi:MAG: division/cell wall cluster transcriptional repressor MraZ [Chloroflexota bacterium]